MGSDQRRQIAAFVQHGEERAEGQFSELWSRMWGLGRLEAERPGGVVRMGEAGDGYEVEQQVSHE